MGRKIIHVPVEIEPEFKKFLDRKPHLYVTKAEMIDLKENYDKNFVKIQFSNIMLTYPPPIKEYSKTECYKDYLKLKSVRPIDVFVEGEWNFRNDKNFLHDKTYKGKHLYIRRINTGNISSDYFHVENRWMSPSLRYPSPINAWKILKWTYKMAGGMFSLDYDSINISAWKTITALRVYICSQFKPNVAKVIYEYFNAENVLDFSMGWGDRLSGFYASGLSKLYVGLDPKLDNHPIYNDQAKHYSQWNGYFEMDKTVDFYAEPAEDADLSKYENTMDLVFTSPPYFNTELYSDEETQSCNRYKTIDDWNHSFLYKTLDNVWKTLKPGGHMLINIADVYRGEKEGQMGICDAMIDYVETNYHGKYEGVIGMQMALRPNTVTKTADYEGDKNTVFAEPIWVFLKLS